MQRQLISVLLRRLFAVITERSEKNNAYDDANMVS